MPSRSYVLSWTIGYTPYATVIHWGEQSERNSLPVYVRKKESEAECTLHKKYYSPRSIRAINQAKSHSGLLVSFHMEII